MQTGVQQALRPTYMYHIFVQTISFNFSSAEPCSEVSGSWYGRISQCCGILVADFVFIAKLVQVSASWAYCTHTFPNILGILTQLPVWRVEIWINCLCIFSFQGCLCAVFTRQPNQNCSESWRKPCNDTDSPHWSLPGMYNTFIVAQSEIYWGSSVHITCQRIGKSMLTTPVGRGSWKNMGIVYLLSKYFYIQLNILVTIPEFSGNLFWQQFLYYVFLCKVLLKETGSQGVLASIVSWVTSSSNAPPVLWDIKVR